MTHSLIAAAFITFITSQEIVEYGVVTICKLLQIIGLFGIRDL